MHSDKFHFDKVIIIDDSEVDRYIATYFIKKESFANEIIEFELAEEAIKFLEKNRNNFRHLHVLILLDIQMPQINGFEFLEKIHDFLHDTKENCSIAILSSSSDISDRKRAKGNPFIKKFIQKPLNETKIGEIKKCSILLQE
jgi:response regulator RpfG family c-di-GMP phosphodiesterase